MLTAALVADINSLSRHSSNPREFVAAGELGFFVATNELGTEVWRTDGTSAGTSVLRDFAPGANSSWPSHLVSDGNRAYFEANGGVWSSDGTETGTHYLADGSIVAVSDGSALLSKRSDFLDGGIVLSDGTATGTRAITLGDDPVHLEDSQPVVATAEYFIVTSEIAGQNSLVRIDIATGTATTLFSTFAAIDGISASPEHVLVAQGDHVLAVSMSGAGEPLVLNAERDFRPNFDTMTVSGEYVYYSLAKDSSHTELWRSNGTVEGTVGLGLFPTTSAVFEPVAVANNSVWFAVTTEELGLELWESDGTLDGTRVFADLAAGESDSFPHDLTYAEGNLWFIADDGGGEQLWITDGTPEGTVSMTAFASAGLQGPRILAEPQDGTLYFVADGGDGDELWISNGTSEGTHQVRDIQAGFAGSSPASLVNVGDEYFFAATTELGREVWKTNGTPEGTQLVRDIAAGPTTYGGVSGELFAFGGRLYFEGSDGSHGSELWSTDGTEAGTGMLADIHKGFGGSLPSDFTIVDDMLYFVADDGVHGRELWVTDGSAEGTRLAADLIEGSIGSSPRQLVSDDGSLFLVADYGPFLELLRDESRRQSAVWRFDGEVVESLYESTAFNTERFVPQITGLNALNGNVYFYELDEGNRDNSLRVVEVSSAGEVRSLHDDLNRFSNTPAISVVGDRLIYTANPVEDSRSRLWVLEGEESVQLTGFGGVTDERIVFGDMLYFDAARNRDHYVTDGTVEGTLQLETDDDVRSIFSAVDMTFLVTEADDGQQTLHVAAEGQSLVDVAALPKIPAVAPHGFVEIGGSVYFLDEGAEGAGPQIWSTDGTPEGTEQLTELPRALSTVPGLLAGLDSTLYFAADDGVHGRELWALLSSEGLAGDLNGDGLVSAEDIDLIRAALRDETSDARFDLNNDDLVSQADFQFLVHDILGTTLGDLDLDGAVDFPDFLLMAAGFGKSDAGWVDGDIDGDTVVDFSDFLALAELFSPF